MTDTFRVIGTFVTIPIALLERCKDANAIHLYAHLTRYANKERRAWPGQERLAKDMGTSVSTVQRALVTLKTAGAVTTQRRRNNLGVMSGIQYTLIAVFATKNHPSPVMDETQQVVSAESEGTSLNSTGDVSPSVTGDVGTRSKEELDPKNTRSLVSYVNKKHPHKHPDRYFLCGEFFCVTQEQHFKFQQRTLAAGEDPESYDWPAWYREKDTEWGAMPIETRNREGPMFWLAMELREFLDDARRASE